MGIYTERKEKEDIPDDTVLFFCTFTNQNVCMYVCMNKMQHHYFQI